jgi:hypothetical protein
MFSGSEIHIRTPFAVLSDASDRVRVSAGNAQYWGQWRDAT